MIRVRPKGRYGAKTKSNYIRFYILSEYDIDLYSSGPGINRP